MTEGSETVVVGIPTYNNEESIGDTIELLVNQTRPPDRILCCDASTDRTPEIIDSYRETTDQVSIETIRQQSDGVAGAYNEILDHIEGEYDIFATIQSDLQYPNDWVEGHLRIHREQPDIDIVTGDYVERKELHSEVQPDDRTYYVGRNFSAKAGTLERIDGWDANFLRGEDWDMRIRLAGVGTRVYTDTSLAHDWNEDDPYVTLSKAKRKPTSVTFLAKYGRWYLGFHPSHVVSDLLGLGAVVLGAMAVLTTPFAPVLGVALAVLFALSLVVYTVAHNMLRGTVDGKMVWGPVRKQLLNGIAVAYALRRVGTADVDWNMTGFDPEAVPDYDY